VPGFLTDDQTPQHLAEAAMDGAAFFVKARAPEHLRARLRAVASHLTSEQAKCAAGLPVWSRLPANTDFSERLPPRQNQIVAMLKLGSTNGQIARVLGLSGGTVKAICIASTARSVSRTVPN
jgi:DNA-binding NarL/FixJ family response regulator